MTPSTILPPRPAPSSLLVQTIERALRLCALDRGLAARDLRRASAQVREERRRPTCSRCGDPAHEVDRCPTAVAGAAPVPVRRVPQRPHNTVSGRCEIACTCPGAGGASVSMDAILEWLRDGCTVHDTRAGDRAALRRGFDRWIAETSEARP